MHTIILTAALYAKPSGTVNLPDGSILAAAVRYAIPSGIVDRVFHNTLCVARDEH
jgi:hypothetical protein